MQANSDCNNSRRLQFFSFCSNICRSFWPVVVHMFHPIPFTTPPPLTSPKSLPPPPSPLTPSFHPEHCSPHTLSSLGAAPLFCELQTLGPAPVLPLRFGASCCICTVTYTLKRGVGKHQGRVASLPLICIRSCGALRHSGGDRVARAVACLAFFRVILFSRPSQQLGA